MGSLLLFTAVYARLADTQVSGDSPLSVSHFPMGLSGVTDDYSVSSFARWREVCGRMVALGGSTTDVFNIAELYTYSDFDGKCRAVYIFL